MKITAMLCALALTAAPAAAQGGFLGVQLGERDPDATPAGALIEEVQERTAASLMGLQAGDLVVAVGEEEIASAEDLARTVGAHLPGEIVDLQVVRDEQQVRVTGVLGRRPGDRALRGGAAVPGAPRGVPGEWQRELQHARQQLHQHLRQLQEMEQRWMGRMPGDEEEPRGFRFTMPRFQWHLLPGPGMGDAWDWDVRTEDGAEVKLRYPGDTPEEERQRLIQEAREKYGDDVEVEFRGEGRSISIRHSKNWEWSQPGSGEADDPHEEEL